MTRMSTESHQVGSVQQGCPWNPGPQQQLAMELTDTMFRLCGPRVLAWACEAGTHRGAPLLAVSWTALTGLTQEDWLSAPSYGLWDVQTMALLPGRREGVDSH